jgi:predicted nucleotidyltransferase
MLPQLLLSFSASGRNSSASTNPLLPNEKLKKVVDLLVNPNAESQREEFHRMQNMLEETLTKNMHLQRDLELLSQELVRIKSS